MIKALLQSVSVALTGLLAVSALSGCKAKELGANLADTQAIKVDHSWIVAARRCWPALHMTNDKTMDAQLLDPIHFRSVFAVYAPYSDREIESLVAQSITSAPDADLAVFHDATSPVLTRKQAMAAPGTADEPTTQSLLARRDAATVPQDALCAIHEGLPIGFK